MTSASHQDHLLALLARFTTQVPLDLDPRTRQAVKRALVDTLAVALGGLQHPGAIVARRYARLAQVGADSPVGTTLWGSGERVLIEVAALANAAPLRGYDYNDLYVGLGAGHPSDMIPGLLGLAQVCRADGARTLGAIALGYEVCLHLFDLFDLAAHGWDYPVVTALAATCAAARLIGLDDQQTREALSIVATTHFVSDEVESGELNARGDLTLWKRFNAGHGIRQAIYAVLLAQVGAEGAVRPFEGRVGLLAKLGLDNGTTEALATRLTPSSSLTRVADVTFKRWPVGSRAQSAIQSALDARARLIAEGINPRDLQSVQVRCDPQVFSHLVSSRADPYHPTSRETADHSLPFIVASAVLDGEIRPASFDPARVIETWRQAFVADRVHVEASSELAGGAGTGFLSSVTLVGAGNRAWTGAASAPPGHPLNPFTDAEMQAKLVENVTPLFGSGRAEQMLAAIGAIEQSTTMDDLCRLTVLDHPAAIDHVEVG